MAKLWQKNKTKLHPLVEKYTVGDDYLLDKELISYDIKASEAHAAGLEKIGIITKKELRQIMAALVQLENDLQKGLITIKIENEDCHTVIENYLTEKLGGTGQKIHTGRSRNDQVLVALRLLMKDRIKQIKDLTAKLAKKTLEYAEKYQRLPMPGYSHTQQAMLSSVGHYFAGLTEALIDDLSFLVTVKAHIDKNPLGSAAGFGVSLPLDRKYTTQYLKFKHTQINSLYCQNSRGKFESVFLEGLAQIMLTLGRLANDLILFTSREFDFFNISDKLVTGSSIMPQKRNLDGLEILRGNVSVIIANQMMIKNICKNLLSGYNRDLQLIKKPLLESIKITADSLRVAIAYLQGITPKEKNIANAIKTEIFAADVANELVIKQGLPFRQAYKQALVELARTAISIEANLAGKISLGAAGNINLNYYKKRINEIKTK